MSQLLAWGFRYLAVLTPEWCRLQVGRLPRVAIRLQPPPDVQHRLLVALSSPCCGPACSRPHVRQVPCKCAQPCFRMGTPFFPALLSARKLRDGAKRVDKTATSADAIQHLKQRRLNSRQCRRRCHREGCTGSRTALGSPQRLTTGHHVWEQGFAELLLETTRHVMLPPLPRTPPG